MKEIVRVGGTVKKRPNCKVVYKNYFKYKDTDRLNAEMEKDISC